MEELTPETVLLNRNPGLRERVVSRPDFAAWRSKLPVVEIDEETFFVIGGDQLKDQDQIIVAWINQFRPSLLSNSSGD
ncbi:hypothetical protein E0493_21215 [Roseomonas sp. M0104]|uniref:Uncharacterized protein n=1 Tax=Teichococcus coralli TaxID=2545983 RepID=A0A845BFU3_9PROT|nr:hypothetical protein [Pseudoroseomonas coralli]MXP65875.1 hypothetical protein [Pseudoroseomonas coralli]